MLLWSRFRVVEQKTCTFQVNFGNVVRKWVDKRVGISVRMNRRRNGYAETLPTVETGRGRHVYAKAASDQIAGFERAYIKFADGELRLQNCYCVVLTDTGHRQQELSAFAVPATLDDDFLQFSYSLLSLLQIH